MYAILIDLTRIAAGMSGTDSIQARLQAASCSLLPARSELLAITNALLRCCKVSDYSRLVSLQARLK